MKRKNEKENITPRKNYTEKEKVVLKCLIQKENAITSKKTNGPGLKEKNEAWDRVHKRFNLVRGVNSRTLAQLKKLWDNLKTEYKKKITEQKQAALRTGGGSLETDFTPDPGMELVMDTIDLEMRYAIDSDTLALESQNLENLDEPVLISPTMPNSLPNSRSELLLRTPLTSRRVSCSLNPIPPLFDVESNTSNVFQTRQLASFREPNSATSSTPLNLRGRDEEVRRLASFREPNSATSSTPLNLRGRDEEVRRLASFRTPAPQQTASTSSRPIEAIDEGSRGCHSRDGLDNLEDEERRLIMEMEGLIDGDNINVEQEPNSASAHTNPQTNTNTSTTSSKKVAQMSKKDLAFHSLCELKKSAIKREHEIKKEILEQEKASAQNIAAEKIEAIKMKKLAADAKRRYYDSLINQAAQIRMIENNN